MKILVIGGGGREHALIWKIKQSPLVRQIFCIPGNAGIEKLAPCFAVSLENFIDLEKFIDEKNIDFTVVGPEQPLADGVVDYLTVRGHQVFGTDKKASQLESSKIFAKTLMKKYQVPTADFATFDNYKSAIDYIHSLEDKPVVVKADGLAAGKGSVVCQNLQEARQTVKDMMVEQVFSSAGSKIVIEEFMTGQEASLFILTDGKDYKVLSPAQDYKRALDGDAGKNTGGMGSYAPTPVLTKTMLNRALKEVVEPVLWGLASENITYRGMLYCGLMITNKGPCVVEFNCRFGDPETQVVLPLLKTDLVELLLASVKGDIDRIPVKLKDQHAVCVIAASGGYPGAYERGKVISGLENLTEEVLVFHAGTKKVNEKIVTCGGRVLGITAVDNNLKIAADKVYAEMKKIHFDGMYYRRDISERGWKMIA